MSYRQQVQNMYSDKIPLMRETKEDGWVDPRQIQMLELRPTNTCNFKCRTCEPLQSSAWYPDGKALGIPYSYDVIKSETLENNIKNATENILPQLKRIHFSGGEALIQIEHYHFLEKLIAQNKTDLELVYNTNLSKLTLQNRDAIELWKKFRKVQLMISVDGWGLPGELIRKGFDTETFEKNLQRVLNGEFYAEFKFHITVSVLNAFHVVTLLKTLLAKSYLGTQKNQVNDFDFALVENPEYYDLGILNAEERSELTAHYQNYIEEVKRTQPAEISRMIEKQLNSVLNYLTGNERPENRAKFRVATIKVDQLRGEKLVKVLPELLPLMLENFK
ncbi:MAG: twitch domain-containing radical SAM protein [Pseudobdellovibrio sp.]